MPQGMPVADYNGLCGDYPARDPSRSVLERIDQTGRKFYRLDWNSRQRFVWSAV